MESIKSSNAGGASVNYTYDDLNRLSTVVDNNLPGQNTTNYTYDSASNVATVKYPNGLTSTFTYDTMNRLTELSMPPVADYQYTLGETGNRTKAVESNNNRTVNWNYDGIYRLTNESIAGDTSNNGGNNGSAAYQLDPVGNRTSVTNTFNGFSPIAGSYNPDDQLTSETYDLDGNVTLAANGNSYTYDSENHMTSANNGAVRLIYGGDGNRVAKIVGSVTTQYLVDDLNPTGLPQVVEEVVNGAVTRQYTYGLQRISESQMVNGAWTTSFYVYDGAGSVRQLTNSAGVVTDEYEYDAYGNSFTKVGTTPNNYLYRGEQFDSDLDLYYLRARYYNMMAGRFVSMDPENGIITDPMTLHKYVYANGDPVNRVDPSGRGAMLEAALMQGMLSLPSAVVLPPIAKEVSCILYTTAGTLNDSIAPNGFYLVYLMPNLKECDAKAKYCRDGDDSSECTNQTSVHGPWHYGNWCGAGGSGTPIDSTDAACMRHDKCFDNAGIDADLYRSGNLSSSQIQSAAACNQQLCNTVSNINNHPSTPLSQWIAGREVKGYFSLRGPQGARCKN